MSKGKIQKTNAMRILDRMGIRYEVVTYECGEFIDGIHVADMLGKSYDESFKTIVTVGKSGEHYAFVLPVDREIDFKKAAKAAGEKNMDPIRVKELRDLTGYVRGGCTAIGMKKQFASRIDESAREHESIYISGGRIGSQIELAPDDFCRAAGAEYAPLTQRN